MVSNLTGIRWSYPPQGVITMTKTKVGDKFRSRLTGKKYGVKKIQDRMVILESQNGKDQILTELSNLRLFYEKEEKRDGG